MGCKSSKTIEMIKSNPIRYDYDYLNKNNKVSHSSQNNDILDNNKEEELEEDDIPEKKKPPKIN